MLALPGFMTAMAINLAYLWMVGAVFNTLLSLFAKDELDMSTAAIGVLFSVTVAVEFVVLFPAGAWADRYGRKAVVIPGLLGLALSMAVMGFSTSVWMLTIALIGNGITGGFAGVPPAAMVSDIVPEHQKGIAMGTFRFFGDIGFLLGPLVAGMTSQAFGFEVAFMLAAIPCLVAMVMTIRTAETLRSRVPA
jgi:MFS family permease